MMTILRNTFSQFIASLSLVVIILLLTFLLFPLNDWQLLFTVKLYQVPFVAIIMITIGIFSVVSGIVTSQYWRQRLYFTERQIQHLVNGHPISSEATYAELKKIQTHFISLQKKMYEQIEYGQTQATERANEREKGLQEVVEQERNRLARDLHDSVSQQLFAASMMMSAINEAGLEEDLALQHQLQLVEKMIHQSQMEMRALLLHLRPVPLKGKSLQQGIKDLLEELTERTSIKLEWKLEDFTMDKGIEDQLFRLYQEAISNILRHSAAKEVQVLLIHRDNQFILRIVDDGKGFKLDEVQSSSYGLQNMEERALELGGTLKIISLLDQGTRVEVKIPNVQESEETT